MKEPLDNFSKAAIVVASMQEVLKDDDRPL